MGILDRAELLLQAKNYSGSGDWLDESGNGHDAQFGSTAGADTNEPKVLAHDGEDYVRLPGVVGNNLSVPSSAALSLTDPDVRILVAMDDWTPAATVTLLGQYNADSTRSWRLDLTTGGALRFFSTPDGTVASGKLSTSTVATGITDGEKKWVRVTRDVDNGASGFDTKFYLSDDGVVWTQLGATVTTGTATSVAASAESLYIGSAGPSSQMLAGSVYQVRVAATIGGDPVLDIHLADASEPFATFTERANSATVTISRSGPGLYVVDQPAFGLHTDDFFEVADHADLDFLGTESYTLVVVGRTPDNQPTGHGLLVGKTYAPGSDPGYAVYNASNQAGIETYNRSTALNVDTIGPLVNNTAFVVASRWNATADELEAFLDGVGSGSPGTSSVGDMSNNESFGIGASDVNSVPKNFFDGEVMAVALFREALTDDEVVAAGEALLYGETATWVLLDRRPAVHVGARR